VSPLRLVDNEFVVAELRVALETNGRGRFVVECHHDDEWSWQNCNCVSGRTLARCEECRDGYADHEAGERLLCTECRDDAGIPWPVDPDAEVTLRIPRATMLDLIEERRPAMRAQDELEAELELHAEAGR
jgi:hypothetical protein